jgi:hypothetical protein
MSAPGQVHLGAVIAENRWGPERLAGLAAAERELYAKVLRGFVDERAADVRASERRALGRLVERDLVELGGDGQVVVAYPFAARPTRHRVRTDDGRRYWAMCAIDALAIPYLLRAPAEIDAREPGTERPVGVRVDPLGGVVSADPPEAIVLAACAGSGRVADCACPHINLFGSRAAAERYLADAALTGSVLSVAEAAACGQALFAGLRALVARSAAA